MTKSIVIAIASAAALVANAPAASAADFKFSYESTSVTTEKGAERVANRLMRSVKNVCTSNGRRSLTTIIAERRCETEMMSEIVNTIEDIRLTNILVGNVRIAQN